MRNQNLIRSKITQYSDFLLTFLAFAFTLTIRGELARFDFFYKTFQIQENYFIGIFIAVVWIYALKLFDAYSIKKDQTLYEELWILIKGNIAGSLFLSLVIFTGKIVIFSRFVFFVFPLINFCFLALSRIMYPKTLFRIPIFRKTETIGILIATPPIVSNQDMMSIITSFEHLKLIGYIHYKASTTPANNQALPIPCLGGAEDLAKVMQETPIDVVYVIPEKIEDLNILKGLMVICEEQGKIVHLVSEFFKTLTAKLSVDHIKDSPILTFSSTPQNTWALFIKQFYDNTFSMLMLIVFSPILILIAILIWLTSGRPIFFMQKRVGLHGRVFKMYKFRTMTVHAERDLPRLLAKNEREPPAFKISKDPRVTRLGRFLRKTSLDEFPQFVNILKGEMSVVGPRPAIKEEVDQFESWHRRRLSMKPGITCLWQIKFRSGSPFDDGVKLDLEYIDQWSLLLDFIIVLKTIPLVLSCKGAE